MWLITISQAELYISLTLRLTLSSHPPSVSLLNFDTRMAAGLPPSGLQLLSRLEMSARRTTDKRKTKGEKEEEDEDEEENEKKEEEEN